MKTLRALMLLVPTLAWGGEWIDLFNGTNLDGWRVACLPTDRDKGFWRVEDGAIVCDSLDDPDHDYVWLVHQMPLAGFELTLNVQAFRDSPGNSGVQVRSRWDDAPDAPRGGWLDGPQVDIHPPGPWRTGYIYDETRTARRWICPDLPDWNMDPQPSPEGWIFHYADDDPAWNTLHIRCHGTRITTTLNGVQIADYDGHGVLNDAGHTALKVGLEGHVALQLHAQDRLHIRFKEIRVREL